MTKSARTLGMVLATAALAGAALFVTGGATKPVGQASSFTDLSGQRYDGAMLAAHPATVYVFLSTQCPVSRQYISRLNALSQAYAAKGVLLVGVFSNMQEEKPEIARYVRESSVKFPIVRDAEATLAAKYGASMTPQAVVVNAQGSVVYKGRVDDNVDPALVHHRDLRDALSATLAGRMVVHPRTVAFGCIIRRPAATIASAKITYAHDVASILNQNCVTCHRAGEIGPMSLGSYAQAAAWRADIKRLTQSRTMPPWKADAGCGDFQDARRLTPAQIAILAKWADAGAPLGNPKEIPPMPHYPTGWTLGKPDLVLEPSRVYHLVSDGSDIYRCYSIATDFTEDRYISAVQVVPGNRAVVHHIIAYIDGSGASAARDNKETEPGYTDFGATGSGMLGAWVPGMTPHYLPPGTATLVPKGARIVLQVHYHKDGKPETDLSKVGIYFSKTPVERQVRILPLTHALHIPAGDPNYSVTSSFTSPIDAHLVAITPHMHWLGHTMRVTATFPDGKTATLVSVSDYDFNWQGTYYYKTPVALPAGTKLTMTATYDNSANNPRNPNSPPKDVGWGEQTTDEMCLAYLHFTVDFEHMNANQSAHR